MNVNQSILRSIREAVGLEESNGAFDTDLLMHINNSVGILSQNGVTNIKMVNDETQKWDDIINPEPDVMGIAMQMIPLFITLNTKVIFDPPPPSAVEQYAKMIDQILWRLRVTYDTRG